MRKMPKGGLEPPRVAPPPPQDGVSTKFHHFGMRGRYGTGKSAEAMMNDALKPILNTC
jgi:hypothetical protein